MFDNLPKEKNGKKCSYKLAIKIFDQRVVIPVFEDANSISFEENTEDGKFYEVELNFSKIFYFFCDDNSNLKATLKNESIDFRLIQNDDWVNPIAQCQTFCLSIFDLETKTVRVKNTLYFFSNEMKIFKCQIYIGLTNDGKISTHNVNLYSYKVFNSIYLSDEHYFSYHPIPDEWFELFVPENSIFGQEQYDVKENAIKKVVDDIIARLGFSDKQNRLVDEEEVYDPYDELVQINSKRMILDKIKSIPVEFENNFANETMKQSRRSEMHKIKKDVEEAKLPKIERPNTVKLVQKNQVLNKIRREELERKEKIEKGNLEAIEKELRKMDEIYKEKYNL